jgi:hypothetical protein
MKKLLFFITFMFLCAPSLARAADMYLILDKSQVAENGTFTGTVYVSTDGPPINNAEATVHFPTDSVSVDSISNAGSIFNIWVEQPAFSNTTGTVQFNGGLPTPGYSGQAGAALRVTFRAKKTGVATLTFGTSAIRANDGNGTNVLSQTRGASITITPAVPVVPQPEIVPAGLPKAPVITSQDMPDQNGWYSKTEGTFGWNVPNDITAVQLILSRSAATEPNITYDPPIANKTLTNLAEGVVYLNARFKNEIGWGKVASRKIQIDTTDPENIKASAELTDDDLFSITASATDATSGVKSFVALVGGNKIAETSDVNGGKAVFELPALPEGTHSVAIRAYDRADNFAETTISIDAPEIHAPKITHYPEYIKVGSGIEIRGKAAYSDGEVALWFQEDGEKAVMFRVKPDEDKIFSFTSDSIETLGVVSVWAETIRNDNARSEPSEKIYINVKETEAQLFSKRVIQIISLAITGLVLLFTLIWLIFFIFRKSNSLRRKLRRDLIHTEQDVHKVFKALKDDTHRYLRMLERASQKRKLTKEESKIFEEMSDNLEETERFLADEIKKIKDEV